MTMYGRGMLVHRPGRLSAAVSIFAAEFPRGDGVLTTWAREHGKTVHHFDGVVSHSLNCSRLSQG
jgi:hypothetical protein